MSENAAQHELCMEVLKSLQGAGVLDHVVLVGSWCLYFYRHGDILQGHLGTLRTDDIDFLLPQPLDPLLRVSIPELLEGMDFIVRHGMDGTMHLEHASMKLEFLIPERGRGSAAPHFVKALGVTAQPLRFLDFLLQDTAFLNVGALRIQVPAPVRFGLHKLIVSERRTKAAKAAKDREQGVDVLRALVSQGKERLVKSTYIALPSRWKTGVAKALGKIGAEDLMDLLLRKTRWARHQMPAFVEPGYGRVAWSAT